MANADPDSQGPVFLERLRQIFLPPTDEHREGDEPRRGIIIAVCVSLSFMLWLSLSLGEERAVTLDLPIRVAEVPEGQALAETPPSSARVQVRGSGLELLRLLYDPPSIRVSATSEVVGLEEALDLPQVADVRVESIIPSSIELQMEPRTTRPIPVISRAEIELASAHELLSEPELEPDSIQVVGAQSIVDSLSGWPTEQIVIEDLQDTVRVDVPLADTLTRLIDRSADQVTLIARAGRFAEATREVKVEVTGVPSDQNLVALQPSSIRIRYRVLFDELFESRRSSEFFATVSYAQIRSDTTGYVEPNIHVPSDLLIRDPEPIPPRLRYYTFLSEN